jgi:cell division GTPase FtsZ
MKAKVIGIGAAGNKAAIHLVMKGVVKERDILLINSTLRDIPEDYRRDSIQFSNSQGGCGKEREIAKELCYSSLEDNTLSRLDTLADPTDDTIIIVNSSEGGTGCGASTIVADYVKRVLGLNVHTFVFTGFEEDGRGLQNTIEYFQELSPDYTVEAISNKKFLNGVTNKIKAEQDANEEFAMRVNILLGNVIRDSEHNIDDTDLYKVSTMPGYMTVEHSTLDKIKNVEAFNKTVIDMLDRSKSLEISKPSQKRMAVILNVTEKTRDFIDYEFSVIKQRLGHPYEVFTHIQSEEEFPEFIALIASGMKMPIDEVTAVYEKYKKQSELVDKEDDNFFQFTDKLRGNDNDSMFNIRKKEAGISRGDFFNSRKVDVKDKKFSNTSIKVVTKEQLIEDSKNSRRNLKDY